jgi:hypothetical protein
LPRLQCVYLSTRNAYFWELVAQTHRRRLSGPAFESLHLTIVLALHGEEVQSTSSIPSQQYFHLSFSSSLVSDSLKMPVHRQPPAKCTSAGRVTARLLLSFLALSAPIAASANDQLRQQQQPIPILAPFPSEPQRRTPQSGQHVFVGGNAFYYSFKALTT